MFLGRFGHNLDAKGRLAIPAKFRGELADGVVVTRGIDRCLSVYPLAAWQTLAEKVSALSISDPDARQFKRMVFAEAVDENARHPGPDRPPAGAAPLRGH